MSFYSTAEPVTEKALCAMMLLLTAMLFTRGAWPFSCWLIVSQQMRRWLYRHYRFHDHWLFMPRSYRDELFSGNIPSQPTAPPVPAACSMPAARQHRAFVNGQLRLRMH